ncbi:type IV pilus biogenesis/stability protein PilW [Alteromonas sp. ASW11-130]|uniref:type IV pilus biogenesis/stability protein PilW n=1 Tax=Alteromonas sp. ASW11-130 TaxID=3015775 RepID=UPI00224207B7|nr:type IV pilus biogenesis/stability protein PilW [Alteromonas sp. ASW11-130]MCW8091347.1 type IV pilus biogenesis/stability protein PilW [Alteromonas sp. ASW11-130]
MRKVVLALVLIVTGCVSQTQPGDYIGDEFDQERAAKTRISLGLTYLKNGNYSQAKANLDQALQYAPRLADTHYSLAYYYQLVGETQRADESYSNALQLAPRNADIANSYGAFLCQLKRYEDANEYFESALNNRQYANAAETYENMALCAQEQGRTEAAVAYLQSALNHQPSRAKSLFLLTELYIDNAQWAKARASLRKYERVARVSAESLWLQVKVAEGLKDYHTAKGYGDMLMTMFPQSAQAKVYKEQKDNWVRPQIEVTRKKTSSKLNDLVNESETNHSEETQRDVAQSEMKEPKTEKAVETEDTSIESVRNQTVPLQDKPENTLSQKNPPFHIVQTKENLYRISLLYNLKMSTLQKWNQLDDSAVLKTGTRLWLVPPEQQHQ